MIVALMAGIAVYLIGRSINLRIKEGSFSAKNKIMLTAGIILTIMSAGIIIWLNTGSGN